MQRLIRWGSIWPVLVFGGLAFGEVVRWQPVHGATGALSVLDLALVVTVAGWLVKLAAGRRLRDWLAATWRHPVWKWSVLFLGWAALSLLINAAAAPYGLKETLVAAAYLGRLALAFGLLWLVSYDGRGSRAPIVRWFTIASVLVIAAGYLQLIFVPDFKFMQAAGWDPHLGRMLSTFYDPNFFGVFLILVMVVALALAIARKTTGWQRGGYWLLLAAAWLGLFLTYSRSAWIAGAIAVVPLAFRKDWKLSLACLAIFAGGLFVPTRLSQRFESTQNIAHQQNFAKGGALQCNESAPGAHCDNSGAARIISLRTGLKLAAIDPVFGVGYNAYGYAQVHHHIIKTLQTETHSAQGSDSSLLNVLATTGVVGLGLFFVLLGGVLLGLYRLMTGGDPLAAALFWFTVAWLPASFFNNSMLYPFILVPWLVLVGVTLARPGDRRAA